ncbi:GAF domain-containing protein [Spirillospora sp. NPDC048911]|uniref:GAF domain-containing protein n=1 Tax=Spirillospora sp. NPDC048911 TaxID=3364527 RepID=UPI00371B942B
MNGHQLRPRFFSAGSDYRADDASMLDDALDTALRHSSAVMGNVQLMDASVEGLRIVAQRGFHDPFLTHFDVVRDRSSACGRALLTGVPTMIDDVATSRVFAGTEGREVMLEAGALAVQSMPMLDKGGRPLGVLSLHYGEPHRISGTDQRLMLAVAKRAGCLLQNCL